MLSRNTKGILCGALSAVAFGMNPLFALPLYERNIPTAAVLFYRFSLGAVLLGLYMIAAKIPFRISRKQFVHAAVYGLVFGSTCLFYFISLRKMDAGMATSIQFVYPVIVALIMFFFFKEKLGTVSWCAMLTTLAGVAMLYRGDGSVTAAGVLYVMLSAILYSVYITGLKISPLRRVPSETQTFYLMLCGIPLFLLLSGFGADLKLPRDVIGFGCMFGLALFPAMLSILLMAVALKYTGATKTAVLGALEPITAIFFGVFLFGETVSFRQGIGVAVIIVSVTAVVSGKQLFRGKSTSGERRRVSAEKV